MFRNCFVFVLLLHFLASSCIDEKLSECYSDINIRLYVKDKYYFNQQDTAGYDYDISHYMSDIIYMLKNEKQNSIPWEYIKNPVQTPIIQLNELSPGRYDFTVWGSSSGIEIVQEEFYQLHENHTEGNNVFVASLTFDVDGNTKKKYSLGMERLKGKLSLELVGFPFDNFRIDQVVSSLYTSVSSSFEYAGETDVRKTFQKNPLNSYDYLESILAPTLEHNTSFLSLSFYKDDAHYLNINNVELNINRNEVTYVKIKNDEDKGSVEVYLFVDNKWEMINKLDIK